MTKTSIQSKQVELDKIQADITADKVCPALAASATQLVFGEGNPNAEVVFIGEAPGKTEDEQGKPFVGAAGQLLNQLLESVGIKREQVYITNIVKYRPPANRDPLPEEVTAFLPYLKRQLEVIKPLLVATLGRYSMNLFLPELRISAVHGQAKRKNGQVYLPLYHPAVALYNGSLRATLAADFNKIPKLIKLIKEGVKT